MKIAMFYHSLLSDWNHGNAHFLRGVVTELQARGHQVQVYEPRLGWSLQHLFAEHGAQPLIDFQRAYPGLNSTLYDPEHLDLDQALEGVDLVIAHEWNEPELITRLGEHRARCGKAGRGDHRLLFHDTHHRCATDPHSLGRFDLQHYDGVLAFGEIMRELYLVYGWTRRAWTWHEAADTRIFHPFHEVESEGELVWVGNWGDEERTAELQEFLLEPVRELKLQAKVHGVRYPEQALQMLKRARIQYGGWLPNYRVPELFAAYQVTVHVPRRPYVRALPGIPTIRVFEAMAAGIPLVCSPWNDCEGLFRAGVDYLMAQDKRQMKGHLRDLLRDRGMARQLATNARRTILARHTCSHRVTELLGICAELGLGSSLAAVAQPPARVLQEALS